ncbi:MAG: hypothetical protein ACREO1_13585 [Arenimonas sp.]
MSVTICPIAIAVGCRKCPIYLVCPVKSVIGDQAPKQPEKSLSRSAPKKTSAKKKTSKKKAA